MRDIKSYDWLEFNYRPLKDGLHDSGYRFIKLVGVTIIDDGEEREELNQWADHVLLTGITNIDVTKDGTIRLMSYLSQGRWINNFQGFPGGSSAMFHAENIGEAIRMLEVEKEVYSNDS